MGRCESNEAEQQNAAVLLPDLSPGTLLSLALTAIRHLSVSSAAGPGRDISPPDPEPEPRDLEPQPEPQDLEPEPQDLELAAAPRSSARRAHAASSRSRSATAPGHCSASTSTRGQERGCGTRETSSPNAQPRPNALAIPRREAPSRCSRHARPATHPARLSKHTRTTPVEQCTSWQRPSSRQGAARKRTASTAQPPPKLSNSGRGGGD